MLEALTFFLLGLVAGAAGYRWITRHRPEIAERIDEKLDD